jgi:hypothetical protein
MIPFVGKQGLKTGLSYKQKENHRARRPGAPLRPVPLPSSGSVSFLPPAAPPVLFLLSRSGRHRTLFILLFKKKTLKSPAAVHAARRQMIILVFMAGVARPSFQSAGSYPAQTIMNAFL